MANGRMALSCVCLGLGYVASAFAQALRRDNWQVTGTRRNGELSDVLAFDGRAPSQALLAAIAEAQAVLISIPPGPHGDPALGIGLQTHIAPGAWIGYLSTTGVYGDHQGGWVFEDTPPTSAEPRSRARVAAENGWRAAGAQVFRLAGIYGPGRSALERVRAGDAQRIIKLGQVFSRIHRDDIVTALRASMARPNAGRIYNICDDAPSPPQDVIAYAAAKLGVPPIPDTPIERAGLSGMAASFYAENRRVSNARAKAELGWRLRYPSYREGLDAILAGGP